MRARLVVAAVATVAATACADLPEVSVAGSPAPSPASTGADPDLAMPRPVADDPDPLVRAGAAARFVSCDGRIHTGGWSYDFGGPGAGATDPAAALEAFLGQGLFGLPATGYRQAAARDGRVLLVHEVDDRARVAVVVADAGTVDAELPATEGWVVETFAGCNPAEFDPSTDDELPQTVWTDHDGDRVPTSTITSFPGPAHCDWQSVTFLYLDDRQYLRDPQHRLAMETVAPYAGDVELPPDAVDTTYRRGDDELWLSADGTIAYLRTGGRVEAWPSTLELVGCA